MANCESPKCATCEFVKGHRQPNKVNTIKKNHMKEQELKKIIFGQDKLFLQIIIYRGLKVGSTTQKGNHIYLIYSQEDVFLLTMPVVM